MKKKARPNIQFIKDQNGHKEYVILKLEDYQDLLEDLEDLATINARKDDETVPYSQVRKQLKKSGKL